MTRGGFLESTIVPPWNGTKNQVAQNVFWRDLNSWFQGSTSTFLVPTSLPPTFNRLCSADPADPQIKIADPSFLELSFQSFDENALLFVAENANGISAQFQVPGQLRGGVPMKM